MPDLAQTLVTVAIALGVPSVIALLGRGIYQQITGRAGRERARNSDYLARSVRDSERADLEAAKRRKTQEYASELRRQAIENGYEPIAWPEDLEHTLTAEEQKKLRSRKKTTL
jgi:hypothetical protein